MNLILFMLVMVLAVCQGNKYCKSTDKENASCGNGGKCTTPTCIAKPQAGTSRKGSGTSRSGTASATGTGSGTSGGGTGTGSSGGATGTGSSGGATGTGSSGGATGTGTGSGTSGGGTGTGSSGGGTGTGSSAGGTGTGSATCPHGCNATTTCVYTCTDQDSDKSGSMKHVFSPLLLAFGILIERSLRR